MNERIRQLEEQAFDAIWDLDKTSIGPGTHFCPDGFEQKFAQLIVRECEQVSLKNSHRDDDMGAIIAKQIREHFGVEE